MNALVSGGLSEQHLDLQKFNSFVTVKLSVIMPFFQCSAASWPSYILLYLPCSKFC